MSEITIGELADRVEINIETIRYYEREGIIPEPPRNKSGYRIYSREDITRLEFIKTAKMLGFSLQEISELLSLSVDQDSDFKEVRRRVQEKVEVIDKKIENLKRMRKILTELITACDTEKTTDRCPILKGIEEKKLDFNN
ncbi:MerR family transcriptional regulator [Halanaerobiaceae bacterium Z-7014]|uniref:MerR family transcriptional regulator n=1 Tax=Halonatronomonas betaini TaxID=2778430 RepID=A0A931ATE5_9FIRM|nr:MerR family transcriptional regulator [Halonatronomonas betaini]MBF8436115.1 MerR family transcriptional regulator [Halonatronomonas betaini]